MEHISAPLVHVSGPLRSMLADWLLSVAPRRARWLGRDYLDELAEVAGLADSALWEEVRGVDAAVPRREEEERHLSTPLA